MIVTFIYILLLILFIFIATMGVDTNSNHKDRTSLLKKATRILQVVIVVSIGLFMYEIIYYVFSGGSFNLIESGIIDIEIESIYSFAPSNLVFLYIISLIIYFVILELIYKSLVSFKQEFKFDKVIVKRMKMISNLFIIKIFISILTAFLITGRLSIGFDIVFIYALLAVLTNVFIHAKAVQEDSDLAI